MKKLKLIVVLVAIFGTFLSSCTKDISGPVDTNFLQRKWNFNKSTVSTGVFTLPFSTTYLKNETGCKNDYIEMIAGGVFKFGNYPPSCDLDLRSGSWSENGSNLVVVLPGTDLNNTFKIAKLTESELILQIDQAYEGKSGTLNLYFKKE